MTERSWIGAPEGFRGCFGHRGAAGIFPENTLEGFLLAARMGVDVIETDAHVTKDGHVVLIHDPMLDRTTDGRGAVAAHTLADLRALDAGFTWKDAEGRAVFRGRGLRIPTLDEALAALPEARFNIELKSQVDGAASVFARALERGGARGRVVLAAEDGAVMNELRRAAPWAPTSFSAPEVFGFISGLHESQYQPPPACALQVPAVFEQIEIVHAAFIARARALSLLVHVWTINEPSEIERLLLLGCDGVITDHPERWAVAAPPSLRERPRPDNAR
jgi:glycerophosphoryl diester phosphodiesterase